MKYARKTTTITPELARIIREQLRDLAQYDRLESNTVADLLKDIYE